jgi:hypothetical protein
MDFWHRSARISRRETVRNEIITEKMDVKNTVLDDIRAKQLLWYGHVQRMDEEILSQNIFNWKPTRRRKRGRPKSRWKESVLRATEECGLRDGDWESRFRWRLGVERRHTSQNYIHTDTSTT